ncbi:MAG TPA: hypothetical protein VIP05_00015, partial [Burkholderiaceae bacterium]
MSRTFAPPLGDGEFNRGQRHAWNECLGQVFDSKIMLNRSLAAQTGLARLARHFFHPTREPEGDLPDVHQEITWNAFPKSLVRQFGRERALVEADRLWPLSILDTGLDPDLPRPAPRQVLGQGLFRPQNEYCEWRVTRDTSGRIDCVTFTSEPPEYWQAMFGGNLSGVQFPRRQRQLLDLYRALVSPAVQPQELLVDSTFLVDVGAIGRWYYPQDYNPYNRWNTTDGIAHLACPPNSLFAEITLAAESSLPYKVGGRLLTDPEELTCMARLGDPDRHSDPAIAGSINALVRLGARVSLANPVGIYMDHVDTSGWEFPDRSVAPEDCLHPIRGKDDHAVSRL